MIRTQIYLTKRQRDGLAAMGRTAGRKQSQLIREAVDRLIDQASQGRQNEILRAAAGLWKERTDLPDFTAMRGEWDRD